MTMFAENLELGVLAIVQARMNSERFPGKVLQEIYKDENRSMTVLDMICERIDCSSVIDDIVIATTVNPADDEIVEFCNEKEIPYYRGSENDLMERVIRAIDAESRSYDIIVDITADCPLIDPSQIDDIVNTLVSKNLDYCSNVMERTWPDGLDIQAYTYPALIHLASDFRVLSEHTGYNFIKFKESFNCLNIPAPKKYHRPHWELTIDYPQDLELIKILVDWVNHLDSREDILFGTDFSTNSILDILNRHPALLRINEGCRRHEESNAASENLIPKKVI